MQLALKEVKVLQVLLVKQVQLVQSVQQEVLVADFRFSQPLIRP